MKYAVIGNSHLGALKRGWDTLKSNHRDITITFFGSRAYSLESLRSEGEFLSSSDPVVRSSFEHTSGGHASIEVEKFDVFVLYGMWCQAFFLTKDIFYSKQVLQRAALGHCSDTLSFSVLKEARRSTNKPILLGHCPLSSSLLGLRERPIPDYYTGLSYVNEVIYQDFDARLMEQPKETISQGCMTDYHFLKGAQRLPVGMENDDELLKPSDQNFHANAEFGRLWIRKNLLKN
ncbi:MAG: hypothetical protein ABJI43_21415 [Roseobacter sp.]